MSRIREFLLCVMSAGAVVAFADAPKGYYATCEGLNGAELLRQLEQVIGSHTQVGYSGLWTLYTTSDVYPDGKIWDMYSTKHWTYGNEQCGTYSAVGDCYNREHSMPKSWFDDAYPMYCDAFHLYPTDGKVNGQRSNYPYGECANGTTLSAPNGIKALGRLGASTFPGYAGTVFEPADEYKGDFARSYLYMAACYNSLIDDWNSDMLAGNSYPAFTTWAVNLLMKWHRQDPVSQKEIDRNEAVYAAQHNRNPFIDHPDMAEYIWGDKQSQNWSSHGEAEAAILLPIDGAEYDYGYLNINAQKTIAITVKGTNLTSPVSMSTTEMGITADISEIAAAEANKPDGVIVNLIWEPMDVGPMSATVTFASGNLKSTIKVKGVAVEGLSANAAANVSDCSFTASWTYVGDEREGGTYLITCRESESDYAITVDAQAIDRQCQVDGLMPNTKYVYWVSSATMTSNKVAFTTGDPIPYIQLLYDGELFLEAEPGEPSQPYELLVDAENIDADISVEVKEPFAISTDKSNWGTTLSLSADEERFYMRIFSDVTGTYSTVVKLTAGTYVNDDIVVYGSVAEARGFCEDFEADATGCDTYNGCQYHGTAATWQLNNAGIWAADSNDALNGKQCLRMGKQPTSNIEMLGNKARGIDAVTVHAKRWSPQDGNCTFHIEYSCDNGQSWQTTTDAVVTTDDYESFVFAIDVEGESRIRLVQTAGARFIIDDIEISDRVASLPDAADYHQWDAFCRNGLLVVQCDQQQAASVYGVDGIVRFESMVEGECEISVAPGLYIVAVGDFTRSVVVK